MRTANAAERASYSYIYSCYVRAIYSVSDNITHKIPSFLVMIMHLKKNCFWKNIGYRNNGNNLVRIERETWILDEISEQE
jgi:hypothetical protein